MLDICAAAGYQTRVRFPHWLGKVSHDNHVIDIIFSSGNGLCTVDEDWFKHAVSGEVFGLPVRLCPPEEMIWSKAFVMERERFAAPTSCISSAHTAKHWIGRGRFAVLFPLARARSAISSYSDLFTRPSAEGSRLADDRIRAAHPNGNDQFTPQGTAVPRHTPLLVTISRER